jgi:glucuronokinase
VTAIGRAHARAALLGNPSDGYGGKAISFAIRNFAAEVELEEGATGYSGPPAAERLIAAAVERFRDRCETLGIVAGSEPLVVRCRSTIPREVGLGGSSAIVIAALRALGELYRVSIPQEELPSLALSVETEELGIADCGRQALLSRDHGELRRLVDRNFDARSRLYPLDPRHVRMVEVARSLGASANYTGSGGAIVAVPPDGWDLVAAGSAFRAKGCELILPIIA